MANPAGLIEYNGYKYVLSVSIFNVSPSKPFNDITADDTVSLKPSMIETIEIPHEITNPLLSGHLVYIDDEDALMKQFIQSQCTYLLINFGKTEKPSDNLDVSVLDTSFSHTYLVDNIEIIAKKGTSIYYKITFVSELWWKFIRCPKYSTNNTIKPISKILTGLFKRAGLTLTNNVESTNTQINYLTAVNDNLFTSMNYLLTKMYQNELGQHFIIYDHMANAYNLWRYNNDYIMSQLNNRSKDTPVDFIYVTQSGGLLNELLQPDDVRISLINTQPRTKIIKSLFNSRGYEYDYATDTTSSNTVESTSKATIIQTLKTIDYESKIFPISSSIMSTYSESPDAGNYYREESTWTRDIINQYRDALNILLDNNVLLVDTMGDIKRKPGDMIMLSIDSSDQTSISTLEGPWLILRVRHVITPTSYRNVLTLGRMEKIR